MRSLRPKASNDGIDMNIAFALSEDVISTRDHFGEHLILDITLESDRSMITIRSNREGVVVHSETSGPVYEAFPTAIREAFYKWKECRQRFR
jgi:hypothetical protein